MSGSGGGGYEPPQRTKFNCDTTIIVTDVSSIDIKVLSKHIVGDTLEVLLGTNDNLILEDGNGEILGAILHLNTLASASFKLVLNSIILNFVFLQ